MIFFIFILFDFIFFFRFQFYPQHFNLQWTVGRQVSDEFIFYYFSHNKILQTKMFVFIGFLMKFSCKNDGIFFFLLEIAKKLKEKSKKNSIK